ncbi:MAG: peptidylprolyl isomerase [Fibrobacteria bacterium]|nr:peptidylprolyl isomerase [Fibrobacteria bacterium]
MRIHLTLLPLILLATACRSGAGNAASSTKYKRPAGDTTAVVLGVDTLGITRGQVEQMLQPMTMQIAQQAMQSGQTFDNLAAPMRRRIAAQLLLQHLMALEASRLKIEVEPRRVDSLFDTFRSQYKDSAAFAQAMLQVGDSPESLKQKIRTQLASSDALEAGLADSLKIDSASVDSFYKANKDHLGETGKVKASHILKLAKPGDDTAKAHAKILQIADRLAKGTDFATLARAESDDPGSKGQGGDLGWFNPSEMVPEFAQALSTMKPGETSAPVRSQFGWHIIRLADRKVGAAPSLDSLRPTIENMLKAQRAETMVPNFYRALIKKYKVEVIDAAYREPELFDAPAPVGQGLGPVIPKAK